MYMVHMHVHTSSPVLINSNPFLLPTASLESCSIRLRRNLGKRAKRSGGSRHCYCAAGVAGRTLTPCMYALLASRYPFTSNMYVSHVDLDDVAAAICGLLATPGAAGR